MENEPEGNFSALETAWTNDSVNVSTGLFVCLCIYLFFTTEYNIMRFLNSLKNRWLLINQSSEPVFEALDRNKCILEQGGN